MGHQKSPPPTEQKTNRTILPHQQNVFQRLLEIARVAFSVQRSSFGLGLRSNSLLVAPTGSGKTHLAHALAAELGVPILTISVSEWILLGCSSRGGAATWPTIVRFLQKNRNAEGVILFIDEIDKLSSRDESSSTWVSYQITEVFSVLDHRVPNSLCDHEGDLLSDETIREAEEVISSKCLVLGAGAFQGLWEKRSRPSLGFNEHGPCEASMPSLADLGASFIPRELANRFRAEILILSPLVQSDYVRMVEVCAEGIPDYLRKRFVSMGFERAEKATRDAQGPRFLEELLFDVLLAERKELTGFCPSAGDEPHKSSGSHNGPGREREK